MESRLTVKIGALWTENGRGWTSRKTIFHSRNVKRSQNTIPRIKHHSLQHFEMVLKVQLIEMHPKWSATILK